MKMIMEEMIEILSCQFPNTREICIDRPIIEVSGNSHFVLDNQVILTKM